MTRDVGTRFPPVVLDVHRDAYHDDALGTQQPTLSKSIIQVLLNQSPAHAKYAHPRLNPNYQREDDAKYSIGTASHDLFLEGVDRVAIIPFDDYRTNAAKQTRDDALAGGRIPLLAKQAEEVVAMVAAIRGQLDNIECTPGLFVDGTPERTIIWDDRGVMCRARLDWLHDDLSAVDDLKTSSRSANPEQWCRNTLWNISADVQHAFYLRGVEAVTGHRPDFRFAVVESTAPYALSVVSINPEALELANRKVDWALDLWRKCLDTDTWPAYSTRVHYAEVPGWELSRWLEREAREGMYA